MVIAGLHCTTIILNIVFFQRNQKRMPPRKKGERFVQGKTKGNKGSQRKKKKTTKVATQCENIGNYVTNFISEDMESISNFRQISIF